MSFGVENILMTRFAIFLSHWEVYVERKQIKIVSNQWATSIFVDTTNSWLLIGRVKIFSSKTFWREKKNYKKIIAAFKIKIQKLCERKSKKFSFHLHIIPSQDRNADTKQSKKENKHATTDQFCISLLGQVKCFHQLPNF